MLFLFLFLNSSDALRTIDLDDADGNPNLAYQSSLMLHATSHNRERSHSASRDFWRYFRTNSGPSTDPCEWRGVTCENGTVKFFLWSFMFFNEIIDGQRRTTAKNWFIEMDWLPSTLAAVHLNGIYLIDGWSADRLPRDLRYLYLNNCQPPPSSQERKGYRRDMRLRQLPVGLEELYIFGGWMNGTVLLDGLPQRMKIVHLQSTSLRKAYVRNADMPPYLVIIVLSAGVREVKVKERGNEEPDSRITQVNSYAYEPTAIYNGLMDENAAMFRNFKSMHPFEEK